MKKKLTLFSIFATVTLLLFTACSGGAKADAEAVAQKLEQGDALEKSDYTAMTEYLNDAIDKIIPVIKEFASDPDAAARKIDEINTEYPHAEDFINAIFTAPADMVNEQERNELIGKIMSLAAEQYQLPETDTPDDTDDTDDTDAIADTITEF